MALKVINGELTNCHHRFWPEVSYTRRPPPGYDVEITRRFRSLPCMTEQLEIGKHNRLHVKEEPPPMPSQEEMKAAIRWHSKGKCACFVTNPSPPIVVMEPPFKKAKAKKQTRRSGKGRMGRHCSPAFG